MTTEPLTKQAARAAYGWGRPLDWADALALLERAAQAGEEGAAQQLALVTQAPIETLLAPPPAEPLSRVSRIIAARGFAPPGFSAWLIERARGRLVGARATGADDQSVRTATTSPFGPQQRDLVLAIMQQRAARLVGADVALHEPPNVISYEAGQQYRMHVDFIDPRVPQFQPELQRLGQRIATVVTYLNEDFEGAETYFPDAGVKFRGREGDAIMFANVLADGSPDYRSIHCALPPTAGRKWVLSQWIRSKAFPYSAAALA